MNYPEINIKTHVELAIKYARKSDAGLKVAGLMAADVVGKYSHETKVIADAVGRDVSTVENWAHAIWLYRELKLDPDHFQRVRKLFRLLPASTWWNAYDIQVKGYDAFYYLDKTAEHRWSGRRMMEEWKADLMAGIAKMNFRRARRAMAELAQEILQQDKKITHSEKSACVLILEVFHDSLDS